MLDEEFKRSERLDAKSRNIITVAAAFFAVVQAAVIGLFNGLLTDGGTNSSFVVWLSISGGLAGLQLVRALHEAYGVWKLRDDAVIETATLRDFLPAARDDNPVVGAKLVKAYADVIDGRRKNNEARATALTAASEQTAVAIGLVAIELVLAFVAVAAA
jgi:hypothetical protein